MNASPHETAPTIADHELTRHDQLELEQLSIGSLAPRYRLFIADEASDGTIESHFEPAWPEADIPMDPLENHLPGGEAADIYVAAYLGAMGLQATKANVIMALSNIS